MLYRIGTESEIPMIEEILPLPVLKSLLKCTVLLDYAYGPDRRYQEIGGYSLIAQNSDDVEEMRKAVDFTTHPCEWVDRVEDYIAAMYLLNDDYSIVLFIPVAIAPETILNELED